MAIWTQRHSIKELRKLFVFTIHTLLIVFLSIIFLYYNSMYRDGQPTTVNGKPLAALKAI